MRRKDVDLINSILLILLVVSVLVLAGAINVFLNEGYKTSTLGWAIGGLLVAIVSQVLRKIYNIKKASKNTEEIIE